MPLFQVTFMNHIVETYLIEADDEETAWGTEPEAVEDMEPERWDCTFCAVADVRAVEAPTIAAYRLGQEANRVAALTWHFGGQEDGQ